MRASQAVVCVVVGFLGLVAFIFGIAAESNRVKVEDVTFSSDGQKCRYSSSPACGLGVIGALCIVVAQIVGNASGGCVCCCARTALSSTAKALAIVCLIFSWILSVLSFLFLLGAGVLNSSVTRDTDNEGRCPYPASWVFPVGACLALVATLTLLAYYLAATSRTSRAPLAPPVATVVEMPPGYYNPTAPYYK